MENKPNRHDDDVNNQEEKKKKETEDKKKEKKQREYEPEKQMFEFESPEDLQEFLEALKATKKGKKRHVIGLSNRIFRNFFFNFLFFYCLNLVITLALTGYFDLIKYYEIWQIFLFMLVFTTIEISLKDIVFSKFPFLVFATLGIILFTISIGAMIVASLVTPDLEFRSVGDFLIFFLSLSLVRVPITQYLLQRKRQKYISKRRK